ncbi:DUF3344 domain-containing protein [Streptomyces lasiicapitis]|uniref:DUF3344 domain-containing protein n=1 Tax=Streptomyces lasiicapitis TaxID=1923961 RepID=UPI0036C72A6E
MRHLLGPRRVLVALLSLTGCLALNGTGAATPGPAPGGERDRIAFAQRYHAVQHGGLVRAANSAVTCRRPADRPVSRPVPRAVGSCADVRRGGAGANHDFEMFYTDIDTDPNTYNSTAGEVRLPAGSKVSYARLYWGGNLRAGEQKPPKDNGRVLLAEPGGRYRAVLADSLAAHRVGGGADVFQASADVTDAVRTSGAGLYTVAQVNVAKGHSKSGTWGGWTLVVAYENAAHPLRSIAVWDGFGSLGGPGTNRPFPRAVHTVRMKGVPVAPGADGIAGFVAYDGDRGLRGDSVHVSAGRGRPVPLSDRANPADDVLNSTVSGPGAPARRKPAYANTLGYDSDVLRLGDRLRGQRGELTVRMSAGRDAAWTGVVFAAVDVRGR